MILFLACNLHATACNQTNTWKQTHFLFKPSHLQSLQPHAIKQPQFKYNAEIKVCQATFLKKFKFIIRESVNLLSLIYDNSNDESCLLYRLKGRWLIVHLHVFG